MVASLSPAEAMRLPAALRFANTIMPLGKKIGLVAMLLLASLATAWAFRKDAPTDDTAPPASGEFVEPVTRRLTADSPTRPPRAPLPFRLAPQGEAVLSAPVAATGTGGTDAVTLPSSYPRTLSPVGALLRPLEGEMPADTGPEVAPGLELSGPSGSLAPSAGPATETPALRTHKIADGDTLSRLAAQYLGSGERYLEIYEYNRDVLTSPDLLPIGKVLKLPPLENSMPPAAQSDPGSAPLVPIAPGTLQRAGG